MTFWAYGKCFDTREVVLDGNLSCNLFSSQHPSKESFYTFHMKFLFIILLAISSLTAVAGEKGGNNGPGKELLKALRIYQETLNCPAEVDLLEKACAQAEEFHALTGNGIIIDQETSPEINSEELHLFRGSCCGIYTGP